MKPQPANPFLATIQLLREEESLLLFNSLPSISPAQEQEVLLFLETEYGNERLEYPFDAPVFDADAALWAARLVYHAAQFLLYRRHDEPVMQQWLAPYRGKQSAAAILSADLTLRFLRPLHQHAQNIDPDDALIPYLERHLAAWPYSATGHPLPEIMPDFTIMLSDPCLRQLYADRIIEQKDRKRAALKELREAVRGSLGDFADHFWKELSIEDNN